MSSLGSRQLSSRATAPCCCQATSKRVGSRLATAHRSQRQLQVVQTLQSTQRGDPVSERVFNLTVASLKERQKWEFKMLKGDVQGMQDSVEKVEGSLMGSLKEVEGRLKDTEGSLKGSLTGSLTGSLKNVEGRLKEVANSSSKMHSRFDALEWRLNVVMLLSFLGAIGGFTVAIKCCPLP